MMSEGTAGDCVGMPQDNLLPCQRDVLSISSFDKKRPTTKSAKTKLELPQLIISSKASSSLKLYTIQSDYRTVKIQNISDISAVSSSFLETLSML